LEPLDGPFRAHLRIISIVRARIYRSTQPYLHQSVDTTVLYAKVDVEMLSEIAQPWPEEVAPC
jgi:hypothetical protein